MAINDDLPITKREWDRASEGIRNPTATKLEAGQILFRFASSKNLQTGESITSDRWACGAWWLFETDYRKILLRYQSGELSLGTVARSAAAVQPSWSQMDVSIKAECLQDLWVYTGPGATQHRDQLPNGMYVTLTGWPDINQIYIPGLRYPKGPGNFGIRVSRQKIITTDNWGF